LEDRTLPVHDDSVTPHAGALKVAPERQWHINLLNEKAKKIGTGRADTPSSFLTNERVQQ